MLTQADWSHQHNRHNQHNQHGERGHTEHDVTLFDVFEGNDRTTVKVWYRGADGLGGSIYSVAGIIYGAAWQKG